ncbi:hypothetical protein ES288_D07G066000v1 [Gossypium darwinii]|uniref:Uncharacterized protein n=1 Tax=Gossypium darwinii TaxID=34276 RepID=A0A5D2BXZ9_GOSDA|nr:hypothetical protein ES288_D07G066000v1 [Gossypium darwinii]TYG60406.1 hypothetical protein ES288_D07G066000v1 [Gossypium darwinii]
MNYGGRLNRRSESATSKTFNGTSSTQNESSSVLKRSTAIACAAPFPYRFESLSRMTFVNPKSSANWSPCSTAVASAITIDRTRKSRIDISFHPPLRMGHPFYHGSRFRMFQSRCATLIFHTKTPNEANKQS